jgi:hypothetical protein
VHRAEGGLDQIIGCMRRCRVLEAAMLKAGELQDDVASASGCARRGDR